MQENELYKLSLINKIEREYNCQKYQIFSGIDIDPTMNIFDNYKFLTNSRNNDIINYCINSIINDNKEKFYFEKIINYDLDDVNLFAISFGLKSPYIYLELETKSIFIPSRISEYLTSEIIFDLIKLLKDKLQSSVDFIYNFEAYKNKPITVEKMIEFIKKYHYIKIKHVCFVGNEFIYSKKDGYVYDEQGILFEDWTTQFEDGETVIGNGIRKRFNMMKDGWIVENILIEDDNK